MTDMALIHLPECGPAESKSWQTTTYQRAVAAGADLCERTTYMRDELLPNEQVWLDRTGRVGGWMQTYTGRAFYPLDARTHDVDPRDIAHALGMLCRYNGAVTRFYSVAEHCVLMSQAVPPQHALWALLHDASKAYMGDMIRPLKEGMPAYRAAEDRLMNVICNRFGLPRDCPAEVKAADTRILVDERAALLGPPPLPWESIENVEPLGVQIVGWNPAEAELRFLERFGELTGVPWLASA
jgi:hypothetical protein